ncbi:putative DNA repair protein RecN [Candidatus Zixiibacteriota bacterium]|nr:putative DNA repair protein RecN [candidate division Zixibacteria bacterium]
MLKRLSIENFALVDKLEISFDSGMSVITGETGAGKSLVVGAIAQLLGEKADKDDIRSGTSLAIIEGTFDLPDNPLMAEKLKEFSVESDNDSLLLRKEISLKGAARNFINNRLATLAQVREITSHLAELFGQHSHQQLLDESNHLLFLDRFAGVTAEVDSLRDIYFRWETVRKEWAALESRREQEKNERELLLFQKDEIEKAKISVGEEETLLAEKKILDSSRLLGEKSDIILNLLESDDNAILNLIRSCRKELAAMAGLDRKLEKDLQLLDSAEINLDELRGSLESYRSAIPDDPERQEEINLRLDEIYRLKKKYGGSEDSILTTLEKINEQLSRRLDVADRIRNLKDETDRLAKEYEQLALKISKKRCDSSPKLSRRVQEELRLLGIDSAKFEFEFIYEDDPAGVRLGERRCQPGPNGLENGRFLISANPGEPLKPLVKTASGGEISRVMLALKAADNPNPSGLIPLLVLDEIDAGIGGATAGMVGAKLKTLAQNYQLLVITHLHQIASAALHHYAVEKADAKGGRKTVRIKKLTEMERRKEIKRMIALPEKAGF